MYMSLDSYVPKVQSPQLGQCFQFAFDFLLHLINSHDLSQWYYSTHTGGWKMEHDIQVYRVGHSSVFTAQI